MLCLSSHYGGLASARARFCGDVSVSGLRTIRLFVSTVLQSCCSLVAPCYWNAGNELCCEFMHLFCRNVCKLSEHLCDVASPSCAYSELMIAFDFFRERELLRNEV